MKWLNDMSGSVPHSIEAQRFTQDRFPANESSLAAARPDETSNATQARASSDYVVSLSEEAQSLQSQEAQANTERTNSEATDTEDSTEDQDSEESNTSSEEDNDSETRLTEEEQKEVESLEARDKEVRIHEQAHASTGGQYAGSPSYTYEQGPDGKRYVTDGEVPIDVSEVAGNPQATIDKMQQVYRAALAPAEPSAADRSIANEAQMKMSEARAEIASQAQDVTPSDNGDNNTPNKSNVSESSQPIDISSSTLEISDHPYRSNSNPQGGLINLIA